MAGPEKPTLVVALTGNPNSGKTTLFNSLTGALQHVGNYPGVTVEKMEGYCTWRGRRLKIVDLPGTYSLTAYSIEELVSRDFIIEDKPDVVVDIIDSSNLERNLYLGLQLLEMEVPVIFAFNMSDEALRRGIRIDHPLLSKLLGVVIVPTVGNRSKGIDELKDAVLAIVDGPVPERSPSILSLRPDNERERQALAALIEPEEKLVTYHAPGWLAMKLLEGDEGIRNKVRELAQDPEKILAAAGRAINLIRRRLGEEPEFLIADHRYGVISGACQEAVTSTVEARHSMSDKIDKVLTNRLLGIPIFLFMMWLVFQLTFGLGKYPMDWMQMGFNWLGREVSAHMADGLWKSLIVDALIGGVGGGDRLPAQHPPAVLRHLGARGHGLHGARGVHHGPRHARDRAARQELHPHADRLRLFGPGAHGDAHARESARPVHDDARRAVHELRGAAALVHAPGGRVLPAAGCRQRHLRRLPDRRVRW